MSEHIIILLRITVRSDKERDFEAALTTTESDIIVNLFII